MLLKRQYDEYCDERQILVHENFTKGTWLSNELFCKNLILWITFWRRNIQRFAIDYLGLKLHYFQYIILFFMGRCVDVCIVGARATAKSFILAVYAVCKCILYPNTNFVITANTSTQAKLVLTEKIQAILCSRSENLRKEIKKINTNDKDPGVDFWNGSTIRFVICNDNARGHRSTVNGGEEAREINKKKYDEIVSPFKIVRTIDFLNDPFYQKQKEKFLEPPATIMISSSVPENHWLYGYALKTYKNMLSGKKSAFLAFDYCVTIEHGIRLKEQMQEEKEKTDPISWLVEYENCVLRERSDAFFTYDQCKQNQRLALPFYPLKAGEKKFRRNIQRQDGEIRILSCDLAFVNKNGNDQSASTCLRMLPEDDGGIFKYRIQIPYIEAYPGMEASKQALRIRQLYEDFDADYLVLDCRNAGIVVYQALARTMFDEERGCEYPPLKCFNDDKIAQSVVVPNAKPVIYCFFATQKKNSDAAYNLLSLLTEEKIDFLQSKEHIKDSLMGFFPEYKQAVYDSDAETQIFYEKPYVETACTINEMINLVIERMDTTGVLRIKEVGGNLKDRYSSLSMGTDFAVNLARDLDNSVEIDYNIDAESCVSTIDFNTRW